MKLNKERSNNLTTTIQEIVSSVSTSIKDGVTFFVACHGTEIGAVAIFARCLLKFKIPFQVHFVEEREIDPPFTLDHALGLPIFIGRIDFSYIMGNLEDIDRCLIFSEFVSSNQAPNESVETYFISSNEFYFADQFLPLAALVWIFCDICFETPTSPHLLYLSLLSSHIPYTSLIHLEPILSSFGISEKTNSFEQTTKQISIFGYSYLPISKALSQSFLPFIPGITGDEKKSLQFLIKNNIPLRSGDTLRTLSDLSPEEQTSLSSALVLHMIEGYHMSSDIVQSLTDPLTILPSEDKKSPLYYLEEYAFFLLLLSASDSPSLSLFILLGDRSSFYEQALSIYDNQKERLIILLRELKDSFYAKNGCVHTFSLTITVEMWLMQFAPYFLKSLNKISEDQVILILSNSPQNDNFIFVTIYTTANEVYSEMFPFSSIFEEISSLSILQIFSFNKSHISFTTKKEESSTLIKELETRCNQYREQWFEQRDI